AVGQSRHQPRILAASVVASLDQRTSGLSLVLSAIGKTWNPRRARSSAASMLDAGRLLPGLRGAVSVTVIVSPKGVTGAGGASNSAAGLPPHLAQPPHLARGPTSF